MLNAVLSIQGRFDPMYDGAHSVDIPAPSGRVGSLDFGKGDALIVGVATAHGERCAAALRSAGLDVRRSPSLREAQSAGLLRDCDLIVVECLKGGQTDLTTCHLISGSVDAAVLALAERQEEGDRVLALELGADDWVPSSAGEREFLARVKALLRRRSRSFQSERPSSLVRFANWTLNRERRELTRGDGSPVRLTAAEYDLLSLFLANPGRALTRDELAACSPRRAFSKGVGVTVFRLRRKLGVDEVGTRIIRNVRSVGYLMDAAVTPG